MRTFKTLSHSLVISCYKSLQLAVTNRIEKGIQVIFLVILFVSSFTTNSAKFSKFDSRNVILFKKILILLFHKSKCAPQFYVIKSHQVNKQNSLNIKMENILRKFSRNSLLFKPSCLNQLCIKDLSIIYQNTIYFIKSSLVYSKGTQWNML